MDFEFFMPAQLVFGQGKAKRIGSYVKSLANRALIVTGKSSAKKAGHLDLVTKSLEKEGIDWVLFDEVEPNPLTTTIDRGISLARKSKAEVIIGLGGGSAMDSAKCIAFGVKKEDSIANYFGAQPAGEVLPIVLITTTAGTGSEANNYAVMTNPETHVKKSLSSPDTFAKISIIDPELMLTVPKKVTASTGIDVFFHSMESYLSKRCQPISMPLSLEAMRLVVENLKGAYEHGDNIEYRERMAWANTIAGIAINLAGNCGIHGLGHPLSAYYDIAHGETLAAVSLAFLRFSIPEASDKLATIAEIFGVETKGLSKDEAAEKAIRALEVFMESLNLPTKISVFGVKEEDIDKLAQNAYENSIGNFKASPREITLDDARKIYRDSL
ncbi:iron-containing alcohol dehydrogenase [Tepidanaerobacter acetatoxydans]|uniref:iron-containing alcohol dehydrogenase n=1 Tax=Tepidanaerobacter acetatoxydans TaxID=499229 RepID=UPI001BD6480B|nr:iron-containing alcohol dehydrogenase [Tepidanaerobacter acetatoxydans]